MPFCDCHFRKGWKKSLAGISPVFEGLRPSLLGYFFVLFTYPSFCFWSGASFGSSDRWRRFLFLESGLFGPFLHRHKRTGKIKAMAWLSEKLTEKPRASERANRYSLFCNDSSKLLHFCQLPIRTLLGGQYKNLYTVFENRRKSLIQHCERSELRLHFEWTKS